MNPNTDIEARLERVEAELAIRNIIALYGLAADCGDIATALSCHTQDAVYVVSNPRAGRDGDAADLELEGHAAISDMLSSEMHQSLLPNCAHTVGPLHVTVTGNTATVIGYSRVYNSVNTHPALMRLAFNMWTMKKSHGDWRIARRESRVMGEDAAQNMLTSNLEALL